MNSISFAIRVKMALSESPRYLCQITLCGIIILGAPTDAAPTPRVWTLEQIEKTGVIDKCKEVRDLFNSNRPTKAKAIWEKFKKKNSALFERSPVFNRASPKNILKLPGRWIPQVFKESSGNANACLCSENFTSCKRGAHINPSFDLTGINEGHVHLDYEDNFPESLRDRLEQAAANNLFLKDVHVAPDSLISDFFVEGGYQLEVCDLRLSVFGVGRGWVKLVEFNLTDEKVPVPKDAPEASEKK